jgi:nitroreductase
MIPPSVLRDCIQAATAAPSVHNTQPWLFRLRGSGLEVLADPRRRLSTVDPDGREMYVSVGAALFNLRVALAAQGWHERAVLVPDPQTPLLAARLELGGPAAPTRAAQALAGAIGRRHTNRRPFKDLPLPTRVIAELTGAAELEGAHLFFPDRELRDAVISLTRTAENRLHESPEYRTELAAWTAPGGYDRPDGMPREAFGPRAQNAAIPLRDLARGSGAPTATVIFEPHPIIALIVTSGDTPREWLQAGAALERVWLTATVRGLAATPLTQLTEIPSLRALMADAKSGDVVQSVVRLGYPVGPAAATPRRPVDEVVIAEGRRPA